jgi:hypothetical protein
MEPNLSEQDFQQIAKENSELYEIASQSENTCIFFLKTGACRYANYCNKQHISPRASTTLVAYGMFRDPYTPSILSSTKHNPFCSSATRKLKLEDEDIEDDLEHTQSRKAKVIFIQIQESESKSYRKYRSFYQDVLPEFRKFGEIEMFKVRNMQCSNNLSPHLRGNVYVQFKRIEDSVKCYEKMNGRFYDALPLQIAYTLVNDWKTAICAYNYNGNCPKLQSCNFLHVYRNPSDEFPVPYRTYMPRNRSRSPRHDRHRHSKHPIESKESKHAKHSKHSKQSKHSR